MKRYVAICLAVIVAAGLLFIITPNTQAAEEGTIRTMLKTLPLESVTYNYKDSNTAKSASVYFSPALLLQDADKLKDIPVMGEIAKASVALAMAAYEPDYINSLLSGMGFTAYDNSYVYHRSRNELTLDDNDYVAYTIAYRDVENPIDGKTYRIYCVPIQGTPQNAEWFSDFNLGKDDEHEGFRKASQEVYDRLQTFFVSDGKNADTRIVWVTGHSRGAACANLIAGWLSDSKEINTKAEHVFGYTYACPAVSLKADTTLKNIFNFNNIGDMVTMLPMEEWGYRRYGQDVLLDTSEIQLNNVRQQFKNTTNSTYAGEITDVNYKKLLTEVIGTDREAFNNSATLQAVLGIAGWALGGKNDVGIIPVIHKYLNVADQAEIKLEYNGWSIKAFFELLGTKYDENDELSVWAYQAYNETLEMTQEEFSSYLSMNNAKIYKLREETGIEIVDAQSFLIANGKLNKANNIIRSAAECVSAAMALVSDEDGEIMDKILHGHSQATYTVWINSMYCGYKGWYDNDEIQGAYAERVCLSIGDYTFYGCDSLEEVTLPDFLGGGACANCLGLRTVTLPADYDLSKSPFYNTCGVTTIYYTPGQTGIMMDRESNSYTVGYNYTLEYCSRNAIETIEFAEGITHIADYLFYGGYHDGFLVDNSSLKTVQLPSTLETIGDYAFYGCRSITSLTLPQSVTSIGDYAFTKCGGIATLDIPATMTYIGTSAFQSCNSLKVLSLPDTGLSIGGGAFSECTGLRTVTLPADYDIKQSPFYNTCGVTTIYYTPGQTGVMMDRESNSYSVGYNYTLEYYSRNAIETVKFAEGITHIADYLFYGGYHDGFLVDNSSLKTVQLPSTLESVGGYAFFNCSALTDVFYCGTQEQWIMIALGSNNSSLTNMTPQLHHYENGVCTFCGHSILVVGDMDGNQVVDHNDAIYLLLHTMFGEIAYPLNGADADIDGNGTIEQEDAVYLLLHTMFGEAFYPLKRS